MECLVNEKCFKKNQCEINVLCNTLGKKGAYPVFCGFEPLTNYSFEEIIKKCHRKPHRTALSQLLKNLITMKLLEKKITDIF